MYGIFREREEYSTLLFVTDTEEKAKAFVDLAHNEYQSFPPHPVYRYPYNQVMSNKKSWDRHLEKLDEWMRAAKTHFTVDEDMRRYPCPCNYYYEEVEVR